MNHEEARQIIKAIRDLVYVMSVACGVEKFYPTDKLDPSDLPDWLNPSDDEEDDE